MNKPSISIIIPIYNVEPYVEACIRSVMFQTYDGDIECIIIDDCGTDQSMAIVEKLISVYNGPISFIIIHHKINRGLSVARNTGIEAASGDYLLFLDSDDELVDDCIEKLTNPLKTERYDIIVGNTRRVDADNNTIYWADCLKIPDNTILRGGTILQTFEDRKWMISVWNKLYLTGFIRRHKLYFLEGIIYEDVLWSFKAACLSSSLFSVNQITYIYKDRIDSIINASNVEKRIYSYIEIIIELKKFVKEIDLYDEAIHELIQKFLHKALQLCSFRQFIEIYRKTRPRIEPTLEQLIEVDGKRTFNYLRDLHYFMPIFVAQYWQYLFFSFYLLLRKWRKLLLCYMNS